MLSGGWEQRVNKWKFKVTLDLGAKRNPIIRTGFHIEIHCAEVSVSLCVWRKLVFILEHH